MKLNEFPQWLGMLVVPSTMFLRDGLFFKSWVIVQRQEKITVGHVQVGFKRDGLAVDGDRLIKFSFVGQRTAEIAVSLEKIRVKGDGLTKHGDGLIELALVPQGSAEVVVGLD